MKTINFMIILISIIIINFCFSNSQVNSCDEKIILTDPDNPFNNQKPSKKNDIIFDWRSSVYDMKSSLSTETSIESPFYNPSNTLLQSIYQKKDYNPSDGWELIKQEFGRYRPDDDHIPATYDIRPYNVAIDYPIFILYNKYSSTLRIFVSVFNVNESMNNAQISLKYGPNTQIHTATLDLSSISKNEVLPTLNIVYTSAQFSSVTRFLNSNRHWYYADFVMSYDPCTCKYQSDIKVDINLLKKAKIDMHSKTDGILIDVDLDNNKNTNNVSQDESFSIGIDDLSNGFKKATETYQSLSDFTSKTSNRIQDYFRYGPNLTQAMKDEIDKNKEIAVAGLEWYDKFFYTGNGEVNKTLLTAIPIVGAALSVFDVFIGGGKKNDQNFIRMMPTAVHLETTYTGTIDQFSDYREIALWMPGSKIPNFDNQDDMYPYYNQILGVFNLLRPPKIYKEIILDEDGTTNCHTILKSRFRVEDYIEYVINPASNLSLNLDDIDIYASIEIIGKDHLDLNNFCMDKLDGLIIIENENTLRSEYVPFQCLKNLTFEIPIIYDSREGSIWEYNLNNLWMYNLNLIVSLKRNDRDLQTQDVSYKLRYPLEYDPYPSQSLVFGNQFNDYKSTIVLKNQTVSQNIQVWKTITIDENVTFSTNQEIFLSAGESISVKPGTTIPSNVSLIIRPPYLCSSEKYAPVNQARIIQFCNDNGVNGYKPALRNLKINGTKDDPQGNPSYSIKNNFNIYPNPAVDYLTIKTSSYSLNIECKIFSIIGEYYELPIKVISKGEFRLDVSTLTPGLYFVKIGDKVEKFVKI